MSDTIPEQNQQAPSAPHECMMISEQQFMRDHTLYSSISSWLFAIAGATNIGLLSVLSSRILTAVEQGKPIFKSNDPAVEPVMGNKKYNRIAMAMMAFGGACMAVSNWLESKKVVTEWQLGAGKLQRKANVAEERTSKIPGIQAFANVPAAQASAAGTDAQPTRSKKWAASVKPEVLDSVEDSVTRSR